MSKRKKRIPVQGQSQWRVRPRAHTTKRRDVQPSPKTVKIVSKSPAQHVNKPDHATQDRTNIRKKPFSTHPVTLLQKGNSDPFDATTVLYTSILKSMLSCFTIETACFQLCILSKATAHQKPKDCAISRTLCPLFVNSVQHTASWRDRRFSCLPPMIQNQSWLGRQ